MLVSCMNFLAPYIEKVPDDYTVEFASGKNVYKFSDKVEVDVSGKKITFKKYWIYVTNS